MFISPFFLFSPSLIFPFPPFPSNEYVRYFYIIEFIIALPIFLRYSKPFFNFWFFLYPFIFLVASFLSPSLWSDSSYYSKTVFAHTLSFLLPIIMIPFGIYLFKSFQKSSSFRIFFTFAKLQFYFGVLRVFYLLYSLILDLLAITLWA